MEALRKKERQGETQEPSKLMVYLLIPFCQKNLFEWGDATIPHTADAVQLTQGISNYLIRCLAIDPPSV